MLVCVRRALEVAARRVRVLDGCSTDVSRTAAGLGVTVSSSEDLREGHWGLTLGDDVIVSARLSRPEWRFALAHELGHVLAARGDLGWVSDLDEELICDWFAIELLAPAAVVGAGSAARWAEWLDVPRAVVIAQRIRGLDEPPRPVDEWVVCPACGVRPHLPGCSCGSDRDAMRDRSRPAA